MFARLNLVMTMLPDIVASMDPRLMTGVEAADALKQFAELERLCAAGRVVLAKRVDETGAWVGGGHRTMADWMAQETGTTVGAATDALNTSWNLGEQPALDDALRNGDLSTAQAAMVSDAAKKAPGAEKGLVNKAKGAPLGALRDECNKTKARAEDPAKRAERCHKARRGWFGPERDGMVSLNGLFPVGTAAHLRAALEKRTDQIFRERRNAEREPRDRYMADALEELVRADAGTGSGSGGGSGGGGGGGGGKRPKRAARTNVQIRVDLAALRRGQVEGDEICDAPGVGELTVGEVELLMAQQDAIIDALLTRGTDVLKTVRIDRYVPANVRRSLDLRDPTCVVNGCSQTWRLERDHIDGFAKSKRTSLDNLARLCPHHHRLKTLHHWVLTRLPDGMWSFNPPATTGSLFDEPTRDDSLFEGVELVVEERCRTD